MRELTDLQAMLLALKEKSTRVLNWANGLYEQEYVIVVDAKKFLEIFFIDLFIKHGVLEKSRVIEIASSFHLTEGVFVLNQEEAMRIVNSYGDTKMLYEAEIMFGFRLKVEKTVKTYGLIGNEDSAIYPCRIVGLNNLTATIQVKGGTEQVFIGRVKTLDEIAKHFAAEDHKEQYEMQ